MPFSGLAPGRVTLDGLREQWEHGRQQAEVLVAGLTPEQLGWRPPEGTWSIADNLAHLALTGRWFVKQLDRGLANGIPAASDSFRLSWFERLYLGLTEPPVRRLRVRAPPGFAVEQPPDALAAWADFRAVRSAYRERLDRVVGVDLRRARVRTPLHRRLYLSLGWGFAMVLAHERRHLWQAGGVRARSAFPA